MRNHRFRGRLKEPRYFLFLGIKAEAVRSATPPSEAEPVADRLWLEASRIVDGFRGGPLRVSAGEIGRLRAGLLRVSPDIARAEPSAHVTVVVHALEIVECDYHEASLEPAVAGWAAAEFGFTAPGTVVGRIGDTGSLLVDSDERLIEVRKPRDA
ncbi:hypothetical protein Ait01nite_079620 [Actinoplanes italicus]|uniref:Uncharacterized protein n=1 Tax=Actinoplanes italicus TaxID=113567 RepID=A0A2T0JR96_9ACTN|nr:hypothetical protein [Actinoplanes italicus]PRX10161.1 hypothetical protein CLV67_13445 [Actinoplanes italicus]GIE34917.1 hypothetical protein Ait01nite_079620 [Actinoplanes italicus]